MTQVSQQKIKELLAFSTGIMNGENGADLFKRHENAFRDVTPLELLIMEDRQLRMGIEPKIIKQSIGKIINAFYHGLSSYSWNRPKEGTFLYYLMLENDAYTFRLNRVKQIIKEHANSRELAQLLLPHFTEFQSFNAHYQKKENILFPILEKRWNFYRPLTVMWSLHDDIRKQLKTVIAVLSDDQSPAALIHKEIGTFYFLTFGMIQKEELIIFPVATETVSKEQWHEMMQQSFEYPFPFIEQPQKPNSTAVKEHNEESTPSVNGANGLLTADMVQLILDTLPVDITVVDEHDKVAFFSRPKDRFFPRSPAVIGRSVQLCHPPESVDTVNKIIQAFKDGTQDSADFRITVRGRYLLIRYFALRDEHNRYKGVLEVSQDITDIQKMRGEQRLLDWTIQ